MKQSAHPYEDADAFCSLYESTYLSVFRYICARAGEASVEAEDLAAETFVRAWNARRSFSGDEKAARSWLLRIARNLIIDSYRRTKVRGESEDIDQIEVATKDAGPEQEAVDQEQVQILWKTIGRLPEESQEILIFRYVLGWPVNEIAKHMNMLENTVSQVIHRSLAKIRDNWEHDD